MISVLIPSHSKFDVFKEECKALYKRSQNSIGDTNSFEFIINNTFFYMFINNNKLIGAIYYFIDEDEKLFLNGFANRNMHELNLLCLRMSLDWFVGNIFAQAQNRASALCLLKCGFKRYKNNIFVYKKNTKLEQCSGKDLYVI